MISWRKYKGILLASIATLYALPLAAAEEGAKAGLPQLDTTLFPEQLFWLVTTFGLLYFLMSYIALPGIEHTQYKRQKTIASELEAAQAADARTRTMIDDYERALAEARSKAQITIGEIVANAAKEAAHQQTEQQHALNKRLKDAEANITATRDAAIKDVNNAATELAHTLVEKVAGFKINPASVGGRS